MKKRAESASSSKAMEAKSANRPYKSHDSSSKSMEAESADRLSRSSEKRKKTLSSSVSVVGSSRSDGGPVPSGTSGSEHHGSRRDDRDRQGHGSDGRHNSPRSSHSSRRGRSGERSRPTSSGGSSSRARHMDPTDAPGSGRASGRATEVRPSSSATHQCHHSRSSPDRRSRSGSRHHDRRERVDSVRSGVSYVSRRDVQLSPSAPEKTEKRTITVIPSPPRPAHTDDLAGMTGPVDSAALADSAALDDSAGVTGPADLVEADDSAGYESAGGLGSEVDEPEIVYDSATVADSAQHQDPAAANSARPPNSAGNDSALPQDSAGDDSVQPKVSARDDSARDAGPAAQGTPAGNAPVDRQDASIVSDVSSLIFPSMPRRINQETLLDFLSMWTLMQHRMEGPTAPDAHSRPVVETPTTTHDQSPPRRPETPVRHFRTPDRRPRTPVRRARVLDETRDSMRSCSPVRRSFSSESCIRDGSPVNFSAALNTEDKVKDRTLSD